MLPGDANIYFGSNSMHLHILWQIDLLVTSRHSCFNKLSLCLAFCGFTEHRFTNKWETESDLISAERFGQHGSRVVAVVLWCVSWCFSGPIFTHRDPAVRHSCSLKHKPKTIRGIPGTLQSSAATLQVESVSWFRPLQRALYRCLVGKIRAASMPASRWWSLFTPFNAASL